MNVHQYDDNRAPDSDFLDGKLDFAFVGNQCRILDGRRTPGHIVEIFPESAMFRWKIEKFEDKGKHWDLPLEMLEKRFQFAKSSKNISDKEYKLYQKRIASFQKKLLIKTNSKQKESIDNEIDQVKVKITEWLHKNSKFLQEKNDFKFDQNKSPVEISKDLIRYMNHMGLEKIEQKTSETYVMNPSSGEWIKGMKIVLAEMGVKPFEGKVTRTKDIFKGDGDKKIRRKYHVHRLAFVRAIYSLLGKSEVALFRAMCTMSDWNSNQNNNTFSSWTFLLDIAKQFTNIEGKARHAYLLKRTIPVSKLFMTYLETEAMNRQYLEAEAVIMHDESDSKIF